MRGTRLSMGPAGLLAFCVAAWAGVVAYVGPTFGFDTQGSTTAWVWNGAHLELNLAPAIGGVVGGLLIMGAGGWALQRLGSLLVVCSGAWLLVGPSLEPLWLHPAAGGLAALGTSSSTTMRALESIGYFYGTGGMLVMLGALALGMLAMEPAAAAAASPMATQSAVRSRPRFHRPSHA